MRLFLVLAFAAALAGCSTSGAQRAERAPAAAPTTPILVSTPTEAPAVSRRAYAAIVIDAKNGKVLHQDSSDALRYPASLTKMMTLYMLFEQLDAGRLTTASALTVSEEAASRPPAKIGVKAGTSITVDSAARALAVRSANDVAVVVAENLAGSEEAFARAMTQKARSLGMSRTTFVNASGLPDPRQVSTARDMALLGRALSDRFPRWYRYFSVREFRFNGRTWRNTNRLLRSEAGVDGIKTGYIRDSGYNLVASKRDRGRHVIAVVIGGRSGAARNRRVSELLDTYGPQASGGGFLALF